MQRKPAAKSPSKTSSRTIWLLAAVLLFAMAGGAAAWHFTHRAQDPEVAKAVELQQKLFADMSRERGGNGNRVITASPAAANRPAQPLSPTERELVAGEFRQQMEKLSEEQRREVREQMGDSFRQRMREMINAYHELPKNERNAFLDKEIDRWEQRRAEFARNRERQGARGGSQNAGTRQAGGGGSGSAPPNRGPRGDGSPEQRNEHRRDRLANSTPEDRAKFAAFFSDMNARRKARGLEEMGPRGR